MSYQYNDPFHDGPEAWFAKEQARREAHETAAQAQAIRDLHASLPAHSSDLSLFTFAEITAWGLKHCRKRVKE